MSTINIEIPTFRGHNASEGVHITQRTKDEPIGHRKLQPGEVVAVDEALGERLIEKELAVVSRKAPTRPLLFKDDYEARYTNPKYKPQSEAEARDMKEARAEVAQRMAEIEQKKAAARAAKAPKAPKAKAPTSEK